MAKDNLFDSHRVQEADYVPWTTTGTTITGVLKGIRDSEGRDGKPAHYFDLYIGKGKNVACSAPTTLYAKIKGADAVGCAVMIHYTHDEPARGGTLKRFVVSVLPRTTDLKSLDASIWGVNIPETPQGQADSAEPEEADDDLPF